MGLQKSSNHGGGTEAQAEGDVTVLALKRLDHKYHRSREGLIESATPYHNARVEGCTRD